MKPFKWSVAAVIALVSGFGPAMAQPAPPGLQWISASSGAIPQNAVKGGYESDGRPFYICRANYGGGTHPGKIKQDFRDCNIGYGGIEVQSQTYEVLVSQNFISPNPVIQNPISSNPVIQSPAIQNPVNQNPIGQNFLTGTIPNQGGSSQAIRNLVTEVYALADSVPANPFGIFLEDWERNQLRESALRVQQLAISAGCFPVAHQANQFANEILTAFMDRNGARDRLNQIRTQAQTC